MNDNKKQLLHVITTYIRYNFQNCIKDQLTIGGQADFPVMSFGNIIKTYVNKIMLYRKYFEL